MLFCFIICKTVRIRLGRIYTDATSPSLFVWKVGTPQRIFSFEDVFRMILFVVGFETVLPFKGACARVLVMGTSKLSRWIMGYSMALVFRFVRKRLVAVYFVAEVLFVLRECRSRTCGGLG